MEMPHSMSYSSKMENLQKALEKDSEVIVVDPKAELADFVFPVQAVPNDPFQRIAQAELERK